MMRRAELAWALGFGLAVAGVSGCKAHPARVPARPVVRTLPPIKTRPDFPMGSLPPARIDESPAVSPRQDLRRVAVPPTGPSAAETQAALAAVQRRQDATLLQQQQAASRRQQEELDHQVEQNVKAQRQMDAQPRIQEPPERPMTQPPQPQGIQDQPRPAGPTL
ncbi:MAG: hypothetical protein ABI286_12330 [Edaphobacter sp.]